MIQELFGETKIPSFTTTSSLGNGSGGILLHPPTTTASTTTRTTATTAGTHPPNSFASSTSENLRCPRCDSTNTKFCYYNNYNLTQPRHFCKTCRRYWTKGGTLRNIPIGGGCRKNRTTTATASAAALTTLGKPNPTSKPRISTNNTISTFSPETLYGKSTGYGFQFDLPLTPALWPNFSNNSHIFSLLRSTHHSNPNPNPNPSPSTLGTNSSAFPLKNDTVFGTNSTNITTMLGLDSYNQAQQGQNEGLQMNVNVVGSSSSWNCHGDHQQGDHVGNVNMMGSSVGSGGSSSTTMELGSGTGEGFSYLINQGLSWSSDHLPPPIGTYP